MDWKYGVKRELGFIRNIFIPWIYAFATLTVIFFAFPLSSPIAVNLLRYTEFKLLPENVNFIVTSPTTAFVATSWLAILLSFVITLPYLLFKISAYLAPALKSNERSSLLFITLPSFILFLSGSYFTYRFIIPPTFSFLYGYAETIGAYSFFAVDDFISLIFGLLMVGGFVFLLPVFMILISKLGLVDASFWQKNSKIAMLSILIFAALITPDGSGVTMILLSTPIVVLYFTGYAIIRYSE